MLLIAAAFLLEEENNVLQNADSRLEKRKLRDSFNPYEMTDQRSCGLRPGTLANDAISVSKCRQPGIQPQLAARKNLKHSGKNDRVLKKRFRLLLGARELHYSPLKASQIINVVCAFHNICIYYRVEDLDMHESEFESSEEEGEDESSDSDYAATARTIRGNIPSSF